ncbi:MULTISPECIES: hypothetical protein [Paraburkholderia]|uniref:hypothetical protein n=1 Tax=Paraburkholderia TaxID=1822464 RepID=UPI0013A6D9A4|nr:MULTISPECIES: hypothetical protein [Paraburkholderia]MDH6149708.1 hypothetical protein [Paraburkholderia sp. WSM4179]
MCSEDSPNLDIRIPPIGNASKVRRFRRTEGSEQWHRWGVCVKCASFVRCDRITSFAAAVCDSSDASVRGAPPEHRSSSSEKSITVGARIERLAFIVRRSEMFGGRKYLQKLKKRSLQFHNNAKRQRIISLQATKCFVEIYFPA